MLGRELYEPGEALKRPPGGAIRCIGLSGLAHILPKLPGVGLLRRPVHRNRLNVVQDLSVITDEPIEGIAGEHAPDAVRHGLPRLPQLAFLQHGRFLEGVATEPDPALLDLIRGKPFSLSSPAPVVFHGIPLLRLRGTRRSGGSRLVRIRRRRRRGCVGGRRCVGHRIEVVLGRHPIFRRHRLP